MCGIVGVYQKNGANVTKQHLSPSNNMMVHRGPDSEGYYIDKNFGMGMRRLSIIGIDSGDQPLSDHSNNIHLVLNGEVYNYIELRQDLRTRGYTFKTESDAECLLYLYQEYGFDAIKHLNGMFGFALWDSKKKLLWVGRDRLGIKPLYYRDDDNNFMFSSTLDSFALGQDPEYDEEALLRSKMQHRMQRWTEVIQSVEKGMLFYSGDAGHFVHYDDPELLISSIRIVLHDYFLLKEKMDK